MNQRMNPENLTEFFNHVCSDSGISTTEVMRKDFVSQCAQYFLEHPESRLVVAFPDDLTNELHACFYGEKGNDPIDTLIFKNEEETE